MLEFAEVRLNGYKVSDRRLRRIARKWGVRGPIEFEATGSIECNAVDAAHFRTLQQKGIPVEMRGSHSAQLRRGIYHSIQVRDDLPLAEALETISHELCHALQAERPNRNVQLYRVYQDRDEEKEAREFAWTHWQELIPAVKGRVKGRVEVVRIELQANGRFQVGGP